MAANLLVFYDSRAGVCNSRLRAARHREVSSLETRRIQIPTLRNREWQGWIWDLWRSCLDHGYAEAIPVNPHVPVLPDADNPPGTLPSYGPVQSQRPTFVRQSGLPGVCQPWPEQVTGAKCTNQNASPQKHIRRCPGWIRPRPAPDVFTSFRRSAYLRPAVLLDFLRDEFLAFGAINIARHFSRRVLLENDQPIVAVHKKGRFVQRLQLRRLIIASLLCH